MEKSSVYFTPFYDAAVKIGLNLNTALADNPLNMKYGTGMVELMTHTFMRGSNLEKKVVVIDEAQNYTAPELKKVLTRIHDSCKVIVVGHTGQIDLEDEERSGFEKYLDWFATCEQAAVCRLTKNYRGWLASYADKLPEEP